MHFTSSLMFHCLCRHEDSSRSLTEGVLKFYPSNSFLCVFLKAVFAADSVNDGEILVTGLSVSVQKSIDRD